MSYRDSRMNIGKAAVAPRFLNSTAALPPSRRLLAVQPIAVRVIDFAPEHAPAIGNLLADHGWEQRYITGQLTAAAGLAADPDGRVLVALTGDQVVGFATVQVHQWNRLAQLHGLAVHPARLRRGIASRLVAKAERFARTRGARGMQVDTPVTNQLARGFYRANGYVEDHVMTRYYADDLDGVTLVKFFDQRPHGPHQPELGELPATDPRSHLQ
jgi:ribosomal protein S18 acetylase RimI-like enzyme